MPVLTSQLALRRLLYRDGGCAARHPSLREALIGAVDKFGTGTGSARLVSGSFAIVTAPSSVLNPLGARGVGEGATIGATPAVVNAVLDALAPLGVTEIPMPMIPMRVWQAIEQARDKNKVKMGN